MAFVTCSPRVAVTRERRHRDFVLRSRLTGILSRPVGQQMSIWLNGGQSLYRLVGRLGRGPSPLRLRFNTGSVAHRGARGGETGIDGVRIRLPASWWRRL